METKYFVVTYGDKLFGLFRSNHNPAIDFQIKQLLKNPKMVVKEVGSEEYERLQRQVSRFKSVGNS